MHWAEDYPLQALNTLRLPARARRFARIEDMASLRAALAQARALGEHCLVLGGGSNVVLPEYLDACVLQIALTGEDVLTEGPDGVRVRAAAGGNWHAFVLACHARGWHGLENLALIPGTIGAAPIQNIGAYGVEVAACIESVECIDIATGEERRLAAAACAFGYRDSVFKHELAGRCVITAVTFRLPRGARPRHDYPALAAALAGNPEPDAAAVLAAVMQIRHAKLPNPAQLPNAGSFFKNPVVSRARFEALRAAHPGIVGWPAGEGVKLAAAWLIDQAGWRGRRQGDAGVHAEHALVLVNLGQAHAPDILDLAAAIRQSVLARFGVALEIEPMVC